jgi:Zinc carboxypeptidase
MKKFLIALTVIILATHSLSQSIITPFEKSKGIQTTTYSECIKYYTTLDELYNNIRIKNFDTTDAGYPLQLVLFSSDNKFNPVEWHKHDKIVILINNGIHPGEPDGIDASMMLLRDAADHKIKILQNIILAVIPVYNIGGCLNRNSFSRANQNGPESYGFRGNAQNLDLNRDFIKADSKDAKTFEKIFQWVNPDIL